MEVIFQHQLTHQRFISGAVGRSRRKWTVLQQWFPIKQNELYSHADQIYKETREKYGDALFKEYAQERRLNKRLYNEDLDVGANVKKKDERKYDALEKCLEKRT